MTAIVASDILLKLSAPGASAGNTVSGTAGNSWGNYISTTQISGTALDNIFADITGAQNAASQVDYACVFVHNNTSSGNSMLNTVLWMPTANYITGGATIQAAADPIGAVPIGASAAQAVKITANTNAPAGVSGWVVPVSSVPVYPSYTNGVYLGSIQPGYCYAVWFKRSAANTAALNNDGFGFEVTFDTGA